MSVVGTANNTTVKHAVTITYTVSSATPAGTYYKKVGDRYVPVYGLYGSYSKSTLTIDGANDTGAGSATLTFTPSGGSENHIFTYKRYTPEKTSVQHYGTYLYVPSKATEDKAIILAKNKK